MCIESTGMSQVRSCPLTRVRMMLTGLALTLCISTLQIPQIPAMSPTKRGLARQKGVHNNTRRGGDSHTDTDTEWERARERERERDRERQRERERESQKTKQSLSGWVVCNGRSEGRTCGRRPTSKQACKFMWWLAYSVVTAGSSSCALADTSMKMKMKKLIAPTSFVQSSSPRLTPHDGTYNA